METRRLDLTVSELNLIAERGETSTDVDQRLDGVVCKMAAVLLDSCRVTIHKQEKIIREYRGPKSGEASART